jgi:hypothetical protein
MAIEQTGGDGAIGQNKNKHGYHYPVNLAGGQEVELYVGGLFANNGVLVAWALPTEALVVGDAHPTKNHSIVFDH